jgi:hypothetical protein
MAAFSIFCHSPDAYLAFKASAPSNTRLFGIVPVSQLREFFLRSDAACVPFSDFIPIVNPLEQSDLDFALSVHCEAVFFRLDPTLSLPNLSLSLLPRLSSSPDVAFVAFCDIFDVWSQFSILCGSQINLKLCSSVHFEFLRSAHSFGGLLSVGDFALCGPISLVPDERAAALCLRKGTQLILTDEMTQMAQCLHFLRGLYDRNARFVREPSLRPPPNRLTGHPTLSELARWELTPHISELYRRAIAEALSKGLGQVVGVIGAGRGSVISCAIAAGAKRIIAFAGNQGAAAFLTLRKRKEWLSVPDVSVEIISEDLATLSLEARIDIVVTGMLGPMGDSELFYESFDRLRRFLNSGAIVIPVEYCLNVVPLSSQYLWTVAHHENRTDNVNDVSLEYAYFLSSWQIAFRLPFERSSSETIELDFTVEKAGILHGFGVWFSATLIGNLAISSEPKNDGMTAERQCLSQLFLPIAGPYSVSSGAVVQLSLRREVVCGRVSYEWAVLGPRPIRIHNWRGSSFAVGGPPE